jgi:hypothetical protein
VLYRKTGNRGLNISEQIVHRIPEQTVRGIGDGVFFKFLWGMRSVKPMREGPGRSGVSTSGIVENPCYAGAQSD